MSEMAMFPLQMALLPGMLLPLRVFEPRYLAMMDHCLAGANQFGVTLIERGSEVGGGDVRAKVGTVAEIVEAERSADGRWAVLAVGVRRIEVDRWLDDDPFPRAQVHDWPDEPVADVAGVARLYRERVAQVRRILAMLAEMGERADPTVELAGDPLVGQWQVALAAPLGALDRYRVLTSAGPDARLALLGELLDDQEFTARARLGGR